MHAVTNFSSNLNSATDQMEHQLKFLLDERLSIRDQERKLEERYRQLKAKNDRKEAEINRGKRQTGPKSKSNDFTLVGTRKAGGVEAGLRIVFLPGV